MDRLAPARAQLEYEKSLVSAGHVPIELVSVFCDDSFNTKNDQFDSAFFGDEIKGPAHATDTVLKPRIGKATTYRLC